MSFCSIKQLVAVVTCGLTWLSLEYTVAQSVPNEPGINVRTINGLKQRRLFDLATSHAVAALSDEEISGRERVDIVVAMIDTLAQKAYQSRDPLAWDDARKVATDWEQRMQLPRKILISVQTALIDHLQVEKWVREVESDSAKPGTREQALAAISRLVTKFGELQSEVTTLLNRRPGPREEADWFSPNELLTLRYNLEYQQSRALQYRAAMYGEDQELNRNDVLTKVEGQLNSVLQSIGPAQSLWWTVQADRIAIARAVGDFRRASQIVANLPKQGGEPESRNLVTAEWIRTLTARGDLESAIATGGSQSFASNSPKLDLARVELFVAMAAKSGDKTWQQRSLDLTRSIEETHGGYWGRLANLSVVGTAAMTTGIGSNLDLLIRIADEAQRKKQWLEAIKALDAAHAKAEQASQPEIAWKLGFRAASIEQTQGRHDNAADRFERLASRQADWPEAHSGYLMACWNLSRTMQGDPTKVERYEMMLGRLIDTWPTSSSADQARIWLASIRRTRRNWPAAIGLLLDVNTASPLFGKAVAQLRDVARMFIRQKDVSEESRSNIRSALVVRLSPLVDIEHDSMPENWKATRAQIVLQLAELEYLYAAEVPNDVSAALRQVIADPLTAPDVRLPAQALEYVGSKQSLKLAGSPEGRSQQLKIIFEGLEPFEGDHELRTKSVTFLKAAKQFSAEINTLPDLQKRQWTSAMINSLEWTGEILQAVDIAISMAKQYPKVASIQIRLAELLTLHSQNDSKFQSQALSQWRTIAKSTRQNSENWYLAKYHVAKLLADQGKTEDASKLLNFIRAVPPGWSKAANAAQFDELYKQVSGGR